MQLEIIKKEFDPWDKSSFPNGEIQSVTDIPPDSQSWLEILGPGLQRQGQAYGRPTAEGISLQANWFQNELQKYQPDNTYLDFYLQTHQLRVVNEVYTKTKT